MITLLKIALALLTHGRSVDWLDEQAHVTCYAIVDSDPVCGDTEDS